MRIVGVYNIKGGVGKTNIVANLGYQLSRAGQRVLILDADLGLANGDPRAAELLARSRRLVDSL